MKKILIGIITIALLSLCACSDSTDEGTASDSQKETVTTSASADSDDAKPIGTGETTTTSADEEVSANPEQKFIGVWSTDELKTNQLLIYDISPAFVKFNGGVNGLFGFDATAMALGDEFIFGDGVSPGYSGPDGIEGRIIFSDSSITVVYDSFGSLEGAENYSDRYTFTIREENSDELISEYKQINNIP